MQTILIREVFESSGEVIENVFVGTDTADTSKAHVFFTACIHAQKEDATDAEIEEAIENKYWKGNDVLIEMSYPHFHNLN